MIAAIRSDVVFGFSSSPYPKHRRFGQRRMNDIRREHRAARTITRVTCNQKHWFLGGIHIFCETSRLSTWWQIAFRKRIRYVSWPAYNIQQPPAQLSYDALFFDWDIDRVESTEYSFHLEFSLDVPLNDRFPMFHPP